MLFLHHKGALFEVNRPIFRNLLEMREMNFMIRLNLVNQRTKHISDHHEFGWHHAQ